MPRSVVTEDDPYPIPLDTLVPIVLRSVDPVVVEFDYKKGPKAGTRGSFQKWEWNVVVSDGPYMGVELRGSTEPKITNAAQSNGFLGLALPYVEAFLGRGLDLGEEVDTDQLIGMEAQCSVKHLDPRPRRDGDGFWFNCEVDEIYPPNTQDQPAPAAPQDAQQDPWAVNGQAPAQAPAYAAPGYDEPPY